MSEWSGLHADGDIVSVAWLPEFGWDSILPPNRAVLLSPPIFIPHHLQLPGCRAFPFSSCKALCIRTPWRATSCVPGGSMSGVQAEWALRRTPSPREGGSGRSGPLL